MENYTCLQTVWSDFGQSTRDQNGLLRLCSVGTRHQTVIQGGK